MFNFPILQIITYGFALWFGLYLLRQRFRKPGMRYTGLGLVAYALGLAIDIFLSASISPGNATILSQERLLIALLVIVCWFAAVRNLFSPGVRKELPKLPIRVVLVGSIFLGLSISMLVLPQALFSSNLVVVAVGLDLAVLSYGIAALDAYDEGETLSRDFLRSLGASALIAILFGGQVVLVMTIANLGGPAMLLLLLAVITSSIFLQTFFDPIQTFLDRLLLLGQPGLQKERSDLRAVASALPRVDEALDLLQISEKEFNRLTRRALSNLSDLKRLASSPLIRLPVISERLSARGLPDNTLGRASELQLLLKEGVARLKPRQSNGYGVTDEWRYYNALYYPYVLGVKFTDQKHIRNRNSDELEAVLEWFRAQVPERTLHNWQNAAAELIAADLREQIQRK